MRNHKRGSSKLFVTAASAALIWAAAFAAPSYAQDEADSATDTATTQNPGWYIGVGAGGNKYGSNGDNQNSTFVGGLPGAGPTSGAPFIDVLELGVVSFEADSIIFGNFVGTPLDQLRTALKGIGDTLGDQICPPLDLLLCGFAGGGGGGGGGGGSGSGADFGFGTKYKTGTAADLTLGYSFASGWRPEVDLSYRSNDLESASFDNGAGGTVTTTANGKVRAISVLGNMWYDFNRGGTLRPYIGAGIGASQVAWKNVSFGAATTASIDNKDTVLGYQAGAGLGWWVTERFVLGLDYRYLATGKPQFEIPGTSSKAEIEYSNHAVEIGLRYYLGDQTPPKCPNTPEGVAVDAEGCPLDSDGDGVPDYLDKCPGTAPGAQVDANGCELDSDGDGVPDSRDQCPDTPAGTTVDENGCPLDADGDGVPDYLDKCPNTPAGTLVDADGCPAEDQDGDGIADYLDKCPNTPKGIAVGPDGCPLDSDGDGIPDYLDECPHSPAGAKVLPNGCAPVGDCRRPRPGEEVDANGCALEQKFILRGVKFEFDSDRLTSEAKVILDGVAATLSNYAEINVELAGHTDNIGSDAYNLGLSERRSNSVKNYLTGKGVNAARMTPVGYGLTQPIADNNSEEGREENRRVELKVIE